jgi:hypothetical protein
MFYLRLPTRKKSLLRVIESEICAKMPPTILKGATEMAIYTCAKCGMSVGTMTCGKCDKELVHDTLALDGGKTVDIAKCPEGHGKVKSPMCCGEDMSCPV